MQRHEVNDQSPMRVLDKSMHGGLGKGNVGVVIARPGTGKTALLVQIALDDLLHDRRVLHITHEQTVARVRSYYDELFHHLVVTHRLDQPEAVRLEVERNRLIYSHLEAAAAGPLSQRGGSSSITKIEQSVAFARDIAHFEPDVLIIDGFDFEHANVAAVAALRELAAGLSCELWLSAKTEERPGSPTTSKPCPGSTPTPLRRFFDLLSVIVLLCPEGDSVRLRLLKDHDSQDLDELQLRLDPRTMGIVDADLPMRSPLPRDPRSFQLFSGGAGGAEAAFGQCAERWGLRETNFSFPGHAGLTRRRGVVILSEEELQKGDFSLVYASHRLSRELSKIPQIRLVLQTIWHQISNAEQVFVIGTIQDDGAVRGGTGWGAELARIWSKPLWVFDQRQKLWLHWSGHAWLPGGVPVIDHRAFAGIGTRRLTPEGERAIEDLFRRSFGEA